MADTPETKVKKKVKAILESLGAYYTMPVAGVFGRSGVPDILCCLHGRFVAIECKANGGKTTRLQDSNLTAIAQAGGIALVVDETSISSLGADLLKLVSGGLACGT
jgi:hypothetical protein